ncbi:juxtaposed with another zinc finger protein 1-like isoform X2 [Lytechinus pictus]|uniref:juxtaposed with another zinc finger protein 1-like isoform X2 n=1 Tax=Lytechinus pictus TaxID=7653 RepID=UPI00240DE707|nr:juxtaposed with another zinc finger protein 1-like isoform X2 [Lytechinus pictus]
MTEIMAVFFTNVCKFSDCGLTFPSLRQLIEHIEDAHIDNDPKFLEKQELQQPSSLPLSYVIKFVTDAAKHQHEKKKARVHSSSTSSPRTIAQTLVAVNSGEWDFDDDNDKSDSDSDNSWTTQDEFSYELILRTMATQVGDDKPFLCPVPGCKKRYKNVNGMKYHAKNGHRNEKKVKKNFKCQCGKSYKTAQGLRQHRQTHTNSLDLPLSSLASNKQIKTSKVSSALSSLASSTVPASIIQQATPLLASPLGMSLANGSIVLESITPISSGSIIMEPGVSTASAALGSMAQAQQTGLIVTLPSGVEPTSINLAKASLAAANKVKFKQIHIQGDAKD